MSTAQLPISSWLRSIVGLVSGLLMERVPTFPDEFPLRNHRAGKMWLPWFSSARIRLRDNRLYPDEILAEANGSKLPHQRFPSTGMVWKPSKEAIDWPFCESRSVRSGFRVCDKNIFGSHGHIQ